MLLEGRGPGLEIIPHLVFRVGVMGFFGRRRGIGEVLMGGLCC